MRNRTIKAAEYFGILDKLEALEHDLLQISCVPDVDFDVDNWEDFPQVCIIPHYVAPLAGFFEVRREIIRSVAEAARKHGLTFSGDTVEDMGEHLYFVYNAKNWKV